MNSDLNIVTVIQARNSSTRLPGKVLKPLAGRPLIIRMYERVKAAKLSGKIVVAITTEVDDDILFTHCRENDLEVYRGSLIDLLDRHYQVALKFKADALVKIPSDCPLIDPIIIDKVIDYYLSNHSDHDFVSNLHPPTYPDGNDVEVMSFAALEYAWQNAKKNFEREHTTPFIWENPDKFRIANVTWETGLNYSMTHRFTVDYPEDYQFISTVYDELFHLNPMFGLNEILQLLERKPELLKINSKYAGVNWYRHHLGDLKTISPEQTKVI